MASFPPAYKAMRRIEGDRHGGYVNDPDDPGGETYAGISRRYHPECGFWVIIDAAKKRPGFPASLDSAEIREQLELAVADFYLEEFWRPLHLDLFPDQALANEVFEEAVNLGQTLAIKFLQQALNALNNFGKLWPDIATDGRISAGGQTVAAVKAAHTRGRSRVLTKSCDNFQGHFYLTNRNEKFINGWMDKRVGPEAQ